MSPRRVKAADINCVQSLEELKQNIARIGELQKFVDSLTLMTDDAIKKKKLQLAKATKAINDEIKVLTKASQVYFSANQKDVVPAGKKSAKFDEGEIGTRTTPESVTIKKVEEVSVLQELLKRKLKECLTTTTKVNKIGLKNCKDQVKDIPGITFNQKEEFFIAPLHIEAEHLEDADEQEG